MIRNPIRPEAAERESGDPVRPGVQIPDQTRGLPGMTGRRTHPSDFV
jgi:hypothetical protein